MNTPLWYGHDVTGAPWPVVYECHSTYTPGHTCPQHDGHEHAFVAWREPPPGITAGPGIPVRCKACGARKCDRPSCRLIRHHEGDHDAY